MKGAVWLLLFTEQGLSLLLLVSGLLLIVGSRRTAMLVLTTTLTMLFAPAVAAPFLALLPEWLVLTAMLYIALRLLFGFAALLLGRRVAEQVAGDLLASGIRGVLLLPFRLLGLVIAAAFSVRR